MEKVVLNIRDLSIVFYLRRGVLTAVDNISLSLRKGKVLGIVGESGSGKSVTARTLLRIESPGIITSGIIEFESKKLGTVEIQNLEPKGTTIQSIRWKEISMIFQEPMTSFGPMHTIGDQIAEAFSIHENCSREEAMDIAFESLKSVGMPRPEKVMEQYPHQISGGMRQRAMIAMALICNPEILIADEPTTALDVSTESQILEVLSDKQKTLKTSIIYISHNLGVVANIADDVIVMYLGQIVEKSPVSSLFGSPKHPYTQALLNSIPRIEVDYKDRRLEILQGNIPDPYNHPAGCTFHPRCTRCIRGVCEVIKPPLIKIDNERSVACHLYNSERSKLL